MKKSLFDLTKEDLCHLQELHNFSILQNMGGVNGLAKGLITDINNGILFPTIDALKQRQKIFGRNIFPILNLKNTVSDMKNKKLINFQEKRMEYEVIRMGKKVIVRAKDIVVGDILLIRNEMIFPCDGIMITSSKSDRILVDEGIQCRKSIQHYVVPKEGVNSKASQKDIDLSTPQVLRKSNQNNMSAKMLPSKDFNQNTMNSTNNLQRTTEEEIEIDTPTTEIQKRMQEERDKNDDDDDDDDDIFLADEDDNVVREESEEFIKTKNFLSPFVFTCTQVIRGKGKMLVTVVGSNSRYKNEFVRSLQFMILFKRLSMIRRVLQTTVSGKKQYSLFDIPVGRKGYYVIHWVCREGDLEILKILLKYSRINLNVPAKRDSLTPLNLSIKNNQQNLIPLLLSSGADPNILDIYGRNTLFYAVKFGNWKLFDIVYQHGGKINVMDKYHWSLLFYSVIYNPKLLRKMIRLGDIEKVQSHRKDNIFLRMINRKDKDGNTCLFYAYITGKKDEVIDLLHSCMADINSKNKTGRTILHYLCMADIHPYFLYYQKKKVLVCNCGEDIKIPDVFLKKKYSVRMEDLSIDLNYSTLKRVLLKAVVDHGANVNEHDHAGLLPIHYLLIASNISENVRLLNYLKKLKLLLQKGVSLLQMLDKFEFVDNFNRYMYFKFTITLLLHYGSKLLPNVTKSNDKLEK